MQVHKAFMDVLSVNVQYLDDPIINKFFNEKVFPVVIEKANSGFLEEVTLGQQKGLLYFVETQNDFAEFTLENNGFFVQLISSSVHSNNKEIASKARALYEEKYLALDRIKPCTQYEDFDEYGSGNIARGVRGKVKCYAKTNFNFYR